jgi:hypothetical protein
MNDTRRNSRLFHFPLIVDGVPIMYCILFILQIVVIASLADKQYDFAKGDKSYQQQFDLYMVFFPLHLSFAIMIVRIFLLYQRNSVEVASLTVNLLEPPNPTSVNYIPQTLRGLMDETVVNARPTIYCMPLYLELWCITSNLNLPPEHRYSWFFAFMPLFSLLLWMLFESVQRQNWYGTDVRHLIMSFSMRMDQIQRHKPDVKQVNNNNNNNNTDIDEDITLAT